MNNYARIAAPLNVKQEKTQPFAFGTLTDKEYDAIANLKVLLTRPSIVVLPKYGIQYTLETDACDHQVGCALLQEQANKDNLPVGYWSQSPTKAGKHYSKTKKEFLAIVRSMLSLRPNLRLQFTKAVLTRGALHHPNGPSALGIITIGTDFNTLK